MLNEARIVLIGFGAQGRAEALNLRRSGVSFTLALRPNGPSWKRAIADEFQPIPLEAGLQVADSVVLNLPDQNQGPFYQQYLAHLQLKRIVFAHGFNTHFKLIPILADGPSHILVAPKGAASGLIEFYGTPNALPAILAREGNLNEKEDKDFAEHYARAIGCHPKMSIWASFKDETECDLFSEQSLLCGGVSALLRRAFETLQEAGYNPEAAYLETLYELKLIVDLIWKQGITGMRSRISPTARYGDITRGDRIIDESVKERMKKILQEIQSGQFTKEFLAEIDSEKFKSLEKTQANHALEEIGLRVREKLQ